MTIMATLIRRGGEVSVIELPRDYADVKWAEVMADEFTFTYTLRNDISAAVGKNGSIVILYGTDGHPHGNKWHCVLPADLARELAAVTLSLLNIP